MDHRFTQRRSSVRNRMLAGLMMSAATLVTTQASAEPSGAVNLAAGEAKQLWLGSTYYWLAFAMTPRARARSRSSSTAMTARFWHRVFARRTPAAASIFRNDRDGLALITYRSIFGYFQNGR